MFFSRNADFSLFKHRTTAFADVTAYEIIDFKGLMNVTTLNIHSKKSQNNFTKKTALVGLLNKVSKISVGLTKNVSFSLMKLSFAKQTHKGPETFLTFFHVKQSNLEKIGSSLFKLKHV